MALPTLKPPVFDTVSVPRPVEAVVDLRPDRLWTVVADIGLLLTIVGLADLVLAWVPLGIGNPEWEFGTVTGTLDGMPVPTMGIGLLLIAGLGSERRWLVRTAAVMFGILGLGIALAGILYVTNVPIAIRSVTEPMMRLGLQKAMLKTAVQAMAYPAVFFWIAFRSWR